MRIDVKTFRLGTDKEAALKPLEEAAEVFGAWQTLTKSAVLDSIGHQAPITEHRRDRLAGEIADCIMACCNLADRYGLDMSVAMLECERRNRERGRYAD